MNWGETCCIERIRSFDKLAAHQLAQLDRLSNEEIVECIAHRFFWNERELVQFCCSFASVFRGSIDSMLPDPDLVRLNTWDMCCTQRMLPLYRNSEGLLGLATDNPFRDYSDSLDALQAQSVAYQYMLPVEMDQLLRGDLGNETTDSLLERLFKDAIQKRVSDVHFSATQFGMDISIRVMSDMHLYQSISIREANHVIRHIKFQSDMDISEASRPQDGSLTVSFNGHSYSVRVSSYPSVFGEDFVCRIFYNYTNGMALDRLRFSEPVRQAFDQMIQQESGLILINGATGAGKTTTIYACLKKWGEMGKQIVTIEDPVEVVLSGIRQTSVNPSVGFDMAAALRAVMRQDPDIIVVGEIRDPTIADLVVQAAYSGHLVIASFHAGSVQDTFFRMASFGVDMALFTTALSWIFCQKLERRPCQRCTSGCQFCNWTGIAGRVPIVEYCSFEHSFSGDSAYDFDYLPTELDRLGIYRMSDDQAHVLDY